MLHWSKVEQMFDKQMSLMTYQLLQFTSMYKNKPHKDDERNHDFHILFSRQLFIKWDLRTTGKTEERRKCKVSSFLFSNIKNFKKIWKKRNISCVVGSNCASNMFFAILSFLMAISHNRRYSWTFVTVNTAIFLLFVTRCGWWARIGTRSAINYQSQHILNRNFCLPRSATIWQDLPVIFHVHQVITNY